MSDFNDENRISISCDPLNFFYSLDLDMYKDIEDGEMIINFPEDIQVIQFDLMEEPIEEYETHVEGSTKEPFLVGDDHIEQYQIYFNKKELQKKSCMIVLKKSFSS